MQSCLCRILKANVSKEELIESQMARAVETLQEVHKVDYAVYTNGSARGGTRDGGAGVVVMRNEELIYERSVPAGAVTSSFEAESVAMLEAKDWLVKRDDWRMVAVAIYSRSLTEACMNKGKLQEILNRLWRVQCRH